MPDLLTTHAPEVLLTAADGSTVAIHRHGGHVVSWQTADGESQLFVSPLSRIGTDTAIRGGVPVIFPQFSDLGPLPKHGFARTATWTIGFVEANRATMRLLATDGTRAIWPHDFALDLTVELVPNQLTLRLSVENPGDAPIKFTGALHTYLHVSEVSRASVTGLRGVTFRDQAQGGALQTAEDDALRFDGEVDRAYLAVPGPVELHDGDRRLTVAQTGFSDMVVWNPGAKKAAAMEDLGAAAARQFVCIEAAQVQHPVTVAPGVRWIGVQRLTRRIP